MVKMSKEQSSVKEKSELPYFELQSLGVLQNMLEG